MREFSTKLATHWNARVFKHTLPIPTKLRNDTDHQVLFVDGPRQTYNKIKMAYDLCLKGKCHFSATVQTSTMKFCRMTSRTTLNTSDTWKFELLKIQVGELRGHSEPHRQMKCWIRFKIQESRRLWFWKRTSGYATWFTAGGAIRIAHYDVIDDVIIRKL